MLLGPYLALATACGESGRAGTSPGAGAGRAGAGGASHVSFDAPCFDPNTAATCLELFPHEGEVEPVEIAQASDAGSAARFVSLGGWAALAEFPDARAPRLVLAELGSTATMFDIDTGSAGTLDILAVWGERSAKIGEALQADVVALGCDASGCQLLAAVGGEQGLVVRPEYALAPEIHVTKLAGGQQRLCAYGEGLFCLAGTSWTAAIPADVSGPITSVSLGHPSVAATADGRVFIETEAGDWLAQPSPLESVISAEAAGRTMSLLDDKGTWSILSLDPAGAASCQETPRLLLASPGASPFGIPWLVADETARVFRQRQTYEAPGQPSPDLTWCRVSSGRPAPVSELGTVQCGDGTNVLGISADGFFSLLGVLGCPVT